VSRAGFTVVSATGKVTAPQANVARPETYTNDSVAAAPQLAMQLSRAQASTKQQQQQTQHPFSSGSKLMKDLAVTSGVAFTIVHNLGRKVAVIPVRFDNATAGPTLWTISDDANSITLKCGATGTLSALVF